MGSERKALSFETIPEVDRQNRRLAIRLRNPYLMRALSAQDSGEIVEDVERPRTMFDDVFGADTAKDELKFFIDYLKNPRRYMALGLEPPKGVLLYGPPGTGKTMLARAMAGESDVAFISKSAGSFVTLWQGSGGQAVRSLFERARRYAPAIIFIDEIDSIGKVRTGGPGAQGTEQALNTLLTEMDGFTSVSPDRPVFILAATNFKIESSDPDSPERSARMLDPALVRRFSRTIKVDLPDRAAREGYLKTRLRGRRACTVSDTTIGSIGQRSMSLSIADLNRIVEVASREAVKQGTGIDDTIFEDAFESVLYGDVKIWDPAARLRTARHEAGHALMYWHWGWLPSHVTIISRGGHGGYMTPTADEYERPSKTKNDILANIRVFLGGRAAELIYYGQVDGLSTGPSSDLLGATQRAQRMLCELGMDSDFGLAAMPELSMVVKEGYASPWQEKLKTAINEVLREQMDETLRVLKANRQHLDALADELCDKERLNEDDIKRILPPVGSSTP